MKKYEWKLRSNRTRNDIRKDPKRLYQIDKAAQNNSDNESS